MTKEKSQQEIFNQEREELIAMIERAPNLDRMDGLRIRHVPWVTCARRGRLKSILESKEEETKQRSRSV